MLATSRSWIWVPSTTITSLRGVHQQVPLAPQHILAGIVAAIGGVQSDGDA
jgi:hypothetical protein